MSEGQIRTEVENNLGWLIMDSPKRRNALSKKMWAAIPGCIEQLNNNPEVRVIILRGAGDKVFTAGADISEFDEVRSGPAAAEYAELNKLAFQSLKQSKKPVIAMIAGFCFGGGFAIASYCDIRISSTESKFCIPAAKLGLGFGRDNAAQLVEIVGPAYAREILFTAKVYDVTGARQMGFLHDSVEPDNLVSYAIEYAGMITKNAPLTVAASKLAINDIVAHPNDQDPAGVARATQECYDSEDYQEGFKAFLEKRPANFKGK